jgi:hypothetical protein
VCRFLCFDWFGSKSFGPADSSLLPSPFTCPQYLLICYKDSWHHLPLLMKKISRSHGLLMFESIQVLSPHSLRFFPSESHKFVSPQRSPMTMDSQMRSRLQNTLFSPGSPSLSGNNFVESPTFTSLGYLCSWFVSFPLRSSVSYPFSAYRNLRSLHLRHSVGSFQYSSDLNICLNGHICERRIGGFRKGQVSPVPTSPLILLQI